MKRLNKLKGMYALLIAVVALIGITIYGSCSADEDFWGFDEEYASTENTRAEVKDMSEYLKLPTGNPLKWTYDDHVIVQKALTRMTLIHEGGKTTIKEKKGNKLNMSEELFNFIKAACGDGYEVMQGNSLGSSNKKNSIPRRKTRDSEYYNFHNCTQKDYVGHCIAHCLNLDVDSVNNIIHERFPEYPSESLFCSSIVSALVLFNSYKSFVQQETFLPQNAELPYDISGIVITPSNALNGEFIYFNGCDYMLMGYNALKKKLQLYRLSTNECADSPCLASSTQFAYYK